MANAQRVRYATPFPLSTARYLSTISGSTYAHLKRFSSFKRLGYERCDRHQENKPRRNTISAVSLMIKTIDRRCFLKTAPAASAAAYSCLFARADGQKSKQAGVRIGTASYAPVGDYPIRPKRGADVRIKDRFWGPKVQTNAEVTIPFEAQKFEQADREFGVNVLEAAITSLQTHPNPVLEAQVERQIRALVSQAWRGNSNFEVAAAYYHATGKRDLLDQAIKTADTLYENFRVQETPFSGGERDAINCVQLYRATGDKKHLDLAKHYLDIRGLENSVNRSRHNQSYKPVLEQGEAVGHAVNCISLMVSLADVGVLTGLKEYSDAAHRMWQDVAASKLYITGGVGPTGHEGFGEPYSRAKIS